MIVIMRISVSSKKIIWPILPGLLCEVINVPVGLKKWPTQVQDFWQSVKILSVSTNVGDYSI